MANDQQLEPTAKVEVYVEEEAMGQVKEEFREVEKKVGIATPITTTRDVTGGANEALNRWTKRVMVVWDDTWPPITMWNFDEEKTYWCPFQVFGSGDGVYVDNEEEIVWGYDVWNLQEIKEFPDHEKDE
ncbi:hypothetical protein Ancab_006324 [Ancistrocladus abbreviatus]